MLYRQASTNPTLILIILIANLGIGLFIGYLSQSQPHIMGSGIPEVEGQINNQLQLAWWPIFWRKFVAGTLAIGSGLILGREGPSIQLGATLGQGLGEYFEDNLPNQKVIFAAGAAAGLAAAFNAPLAGTFFVLEEIYHNFSPLIWMSTLASSLSADFISMNIFSLTPVLHLGTIPYFPLNRYWQLIALGIIIGLLGYLYQRVLLSVPKCYQYFFSRIPRAYHECIALLLIVPLGYFYPDLLGGGNKLILHLATIHWPISGIIALFLIRFIVSMIDYGSGLPGGIFLPILSLGAILGLLVSQLFVSWQLLPATYISNFIVLGMAGYFACISKAPFTAILLITEMVGSLNHLMPLALTALSAYVVVDFLGGAPIYTSLLENMQLKRTLTTFSDKSTF
ncbi:MAG: ClC family H(+)/Cl(-) exchange transporter [Lactobacillus sp.]|nr:ClC family H(+)/Cl(-) exchange transporter [Lactobacillus sp.]